MLLIVVDFFYLNVACKAENELVSGFTPGELSLEEASMLVYL